MRRIRRFNFSKMFIIFLIIISIVVLGFVFVDRSIKPTVIAMSEARVRYIAVKSMNNAVKKVLGTDLKYTDLITVLTDRDGRVSMLQANTMKMNILASETSSQAQDEILVNGSKGIYVPLGSVLGGRILAGSGPKINVRMIPVGSVSTEFSSEFENAGINQTRHKIYLVLRARVRIVVPLGSDVSDIVTKVPITETIIVGDVPQNYVNVDETDKMLNLVPDINE